MKTFKFFLIIQGLFIINASPMHAQSDVNDKIVKKSGEMIVCKVLSVSEFNVEINPEGEIPFLIIPRGEIDSIIYRDGTVVKISQENKHSVITELFLYKPFLMLYNSYFVKAGKKITSNPPINELTKLEWGNQYTFCGVKLSDALHAKRNQSFGFSESPLYYYADNELKNFSVEVKIDIDYTYYWKEFPIRFFEKADIHKLTISAIIRENDVVTKTNSFNFSQSDLSSDDEVNKKLDSFIYKEIRITPYLQLRNFLFRVTFEFGK